MRVVRPDEGLRYSVMGAVTVFKATAADTGGAYSLGVETTPPAGGFPLHVHHREDEAMYILEGEYEIHCGDDVIRATPGTFVFLPRDTPNRYRNCGESPGKFLYITSPGGFEAVVAETSALMSQREPDMEKVQAAGLRHGIEFI